jgi:hypothetical protein
MEEENRRMSDELAARQPSPRRAEGPARQKNPWGDAGRLSAVGEDDGRKQIAGDDDFAT